MKYENLQHRLIANSVVADDSYPLVNGEPCWLWIGARNRGGYGTLSVRKNGKVRAAKAHRVSLEVFKNRRLGRRLVGSHLCNVPWCINPNHLVGGTTATNNRRIVKSGNHWSGFQGPKPIQPQESL